MCSVFWLFWLSCQYLPPSSLDAVKSRMVYHSGTGLARLSWNTEVCACVCTCVHMCVHVCFEVMCYAGQKPVLSKHILQLHGYIASDVIADVCYLAWQFFLNLLPSTLHMDSKYAGVTSSPTEVMFVYYRVMSVNGVQMALCIYTLGDFIFR